MSTDCRWQQRFQNYSLALEQLNAAVLLSEQRALSDLEQQGLIQSFEYTHELAWNTMKDYLHHQGNFDIKGSRDATRSAFQIDLISDGDAWMQMIPARNMTSHAYDKTISDQIVHRICQDYLPLFIEFKQTMSTLIEYD